MVRHFFLAREGYLFPLEYTITELHITDMPKRRKFFYSSVMDACTEGGETKM